MLRLIVAITELIVAAGVAYTASQDFFGKKNIGEAGAGEGALLRASRWLQVGFIALVATDGASRLLLGQSIFALLLNLILNPGG